MFVASFLPSIALAGTGPIQIGFDRIATAKNLYFDRSPRSMPLKSGPTLVSVDQKRQVVYYDILTLQPKPTPFTNATYWDLSPALTLEGRLVAPLSYNTGKDGTPTGVEHLALVDLETGVTVRSLDSVTDQVRGVEDHWVGQGQYQLMLYGAAQSRWIYDVLGDRLVAGPVDGDGGGNYGHDRVVQVEGELVELRSDIQKDVPSLQLMARSFGPKAIWRKMPPVFSSYDTFIQSSAPTKIGNEPAILVRYGDRIKGDIVSYVYFPKRGEWEAHPEMLGWGRLLDTPHLPSGKPVPFQRGTTEIEWRSPGTLAVSARSSWKTPIHVRSYEDFEFGGQAFVLARGNTREDGYGDNRFIVFSSTGQAILEEKDGYSPVLTVTDTAAYLTMEIGIGDWGTWRILSR